MLHTLQWVSWMSSCWKMYAVTKQNNNDMSGKPTVARHNFLNDRARCIELLLLPTLFSSMLAALSDMLAFVHQATTVYVCVRVCVKSNCRSGIQSGSCAAQIHIVFPAVDSNPMIPGWGGMILFYMLWWKEITGCYSSATIANGITKIADW